MFPIIARFSILAFLLTLLYLPAQASHSETLLQQVEFDQILGLAQRAPDEVLRYGESDAQYIEFWHPKTDIKPAPAVILVHGGCWLNAFAVDHTRGAATALADQGFAVWAVEYRRLGDDGGGWPNSRDDVTLAMNKLYFLSPPSVNLQKVVVAGHSAGGHLALHAIERSSLKPALTVGLAPITDMPAYMAGDGSCQRAAAEFVASAPNAEPHSLSVVTESSLPRVLFFGQADRIVDTEQASLVDTASVLVEAAGHFDFIHPATLAWATWLQHVKDALED